MPVHQTYAFHDWCENRRSHGAQRINRADAAQWNSEGFGIFATVNEFRGSRTKSNLIRINAWAVDMDEGSKAEMLLRIESGLVPSAVVETRRGYQVWFFAKDATVETWNQIVEYRLIPFYKADQRAKDLCRILRVPGFLHQKDPAHPFMVTLVHRANVAYTEAEMFHFYPDQITGQRQRDEHSKAKQQLPASGSLWESLWHLQSEDALTRLSGSVHVQGEIYSFRENASGTKNILVDGKSTSCWVDREGRIGSSDGGGPTIGQWLHWYHRDWKRVVQILREVFPELFQNEVPR